MFPANIKPDPKIEGNMPGVKALCKPLFCLRLSEHDKSLEPLPVAFLEVAFLEDKASPM